MAEPTTDTNDALAGTATKFFQQFVALGEYIPVSAVVTLTVHSGVGERDCDGGAGNGLAAPRLYRGRPPISHPSLRHLGTSRFFGIERASQELACVPRVFYWEGSSAAVKWMEEHAHGHSFVA